MSFEDIFRAATGNAPYDYQRRLACGECDDRSERAWLEGGAKCESRLIDIPTGLGSPKPI